MDEIERIEYSGNFEVLEDIPGVSIERLGTYSYPRSSGTRARVRFEAVRVRAEHYEQQYGGYGGDTAYWYRLTNGQVVYFNTGSPSTGAILRRSKS